jgi:hypothetical protein
MSSGPGSFCSKPENRFSTATVYNIGDIVCATSDDGKTDKYICLQSRGDAGHGPGTPGLWSKYRDTYKEKASYKCSESVKKDNIIYISNAKSPSKGMDSFVKFIDLKTKNAYPIFNELTCGPFEPKPVKVDVDLADFKEEASGPVSSVETVSGPISSEVAVSGPMSSEVAVNVPESVPTFPAAMGGYRRKTRGRKGKKVRKTTRRR